MAGYLHRNGVSKSHSRGKFNRSSARTKSANLRLSSMRGGIRF